VLWQCRWYQGLKMSFQDKPRSPHPFMCGSMSHVFERIEWKLEEMRQDGFTYWLWLVFIGMAIVSVVIKSLKMAVAVGITFIFLNIFLQFAGKKTIKQNKEGI